MENRTKLDSAEPAVQFNFEQGSTKSVQTKDALRVNQQSTTGHSLSAERYYEAGRRLEDENCENEAIEYFQKSLACIPNILGITRAYQDVSSFRNGLKMHGLQPGPLWFAIRQMKVQINWPSVSSPISKNCVRTGSISTYTDVCGPTRRHQILRIN